MRFCLLVALSVFSAFPPAHAEVYDIDPVHSSVGFKIRHMVVSKTSGKFNDFSGTIHYDENNPKAWAAEAVIQTASIDTSNAKRDEHLRGADFFDVGKYPTIKFKSGKIGKIKDGKGKLHGELTMLGVTKPVVLDLEIHGAMNGIAGFSATTTVDRTDFGISWNKVLDAGGLAIGKEVEITLEIEAHEKKSK